LRSSKKPPYFQASGNYRQEYLPARRKESRRASASICAKSVEGRSHIRRSHLEQAIVNQAAQQVGQILTQQSGLYIVLVEQLLIGHFDFSAPPSPTCHMARSRLIQTKIALGLDVQEHGLFVQKAAPGHARERRRGSISDNHHFRPPRSRA